MFEGNLTIVIDHILQIIIKNNKNCDGHNNFIAKMVKLYYGTTNELLFLISAQHIISPYTSIIYISFKSFSWEKSLRSDILFFLIKFNKLKIKFNFTRIIGVTPGRIKCFEIDKLAKSWLYALEIMCKEFIKRNLV